MLGSWTVAAAGNSCQLTMVLTTWTGGYRASTRGCSNEALSGISAWNLEGNQVQLMNDTGATVARLYPASKHAVQRTDRGRRPDQRLALIVAAAVSAAAWLPGPMRR